MHGKKRVVERVGRAFRVSRVCHSLVRTCRHISVSVCTLSMAVPSPNVHLSAHLLVSVDSLKTCANMFIHHQKNHPACTPCPDSTAQGSMIGPTPRRSPRRTPILGSTRPRQARSMMTRSGRMSSSPTMVRRLHTSLCTHVLQTTPSALAPSHCLCVCSSSARHLYGARHVSIMPILGRISCIVILFD